MTVATAIGVNTQDHRQWARSLKPTKGLSRPFGTGLGGFREAVGTARRSSPHSVTAMIAGVESGYEPRILGLDRLPVIASAHTELRA